MRLTDWTSIACHMVLNLWQSLLGAFNVKKLSERGTWVAQTISLFKSKGYIDLFDLINY